MAKSKTKKSKKQQKKEGNNWYGFTISSLIAFLLIMFWLLIGSSFITTLETFDESTIPINPNKMPYTGWPYDDNTIIGSFFKKSWITTRKITSQGITSIAEALSTLGATNTEAKEAAEALLIVGLPFAAWILAISTWFVAGASIVYALFAAINIRTFLLGLFILFTGLWIPIVTILATVQLFKISYDLLLVPLFTPGTPIRQILQRHWAVVTMLISLSLAIPGAVYLTGPAQLGVIGGALGIGTIAIATKLLEMIF